MQQLAAGQSNEKKKKKLEKKSSKVLSCSTRLCLFCFQAVLGLAQGRDARRASPPVPMKGFGTCREFDQLLT